MLIASGLPMKFDPSSHHARAVNGRATMAFALGFGAIAGCASQAELGGDDQDGIAGGIFAPMMVVDDKTFSPAILKTQNLADVTLTLRNAGTKPHGFAVACLPSACFPAAATMAPIAPGTSATAVFQTPRVEGLYAFGSSAPGDPQAGQFIVE